MKVGLLSRMRALSAANPSILRQWISLVIATFVVVGLVFVLRPYCKRMSDATPHPAETKLGDFEGRLFETNFVAPIGELFSLVIGASDNGDLRRQLKGNIVVRHEDKVLAEFSFAPDRVEDCNWLSNHGLTGYILTWGTSNVLEQLLERGKSYDVALSLDEPFNRSASLWLTYIQPFREYQAQRRAGVAAK